MSNIVFVSGDFSSGTTLLFTLFRKTGDYHCLYEPLHERLPVYQIAGLPVYDRHFHVDDYFTEYEGFDRLRDLFDPAWGISDLHLTEEDSAGGLYRYLTYLIGRSFEREPRVLLQFNRASFRLGWLRANFPRARIVHIWRDRDEQWQSLVRRVQEHHGEEEVGQDSPGFTGFNLSTWCDDLADDYPDLAAGDSRTGFERFSKLWKRSREEQQRYADVSVQLRDLREDFVPTFRSIRNAVDGAFPVEPLAQYVIRGDRSSACEDREAEEWGDSVTRLIHRIRVRWAEAYLSFRSPDDG